MISQTNRNLSDYYPANSSRATASLKRTAQDLELPDPPSKSRRVKFMKYRIRMDPKKSEPLAQISEEAYCNYTIGITWRLRMSDQKDSTRASQNCISQEPGTEVLKRSLNSVQRRSLLMSRNGNHKAAVELLSTSLTSLTIDLNNLESNFKDILVELHLRLAEEYNFTGQLSKGLSTLEQVWNPQMPLSITWGHKLFKNIANLYCTLKKGSA
ncbi:hypothetical protein H4Q26_017841 [Puccinia striiformis f. sp. tritici PST-130]|nr:hypothetical protein H4Q26_017841 [Puccinia striiformis f. sp. tritici PST-130]